MGRSTMMKILTSIVATTMLVGLALAVDHDVGSPSGGWDTSTDLGSWASSQTFSVGDNIVFSYAPNHNVLEVSEADYDSCSTSNAISTNALTPTTIALKEAGSRYFICGTPGHCDQGMKVTIKTVASSSSSPSPTTTTPSPSTTPPTTTTPSSTPPASTTSPPTSSSDDTPSPPISTPETTVPPSPSSAETVKVAAVFMMGFGVLMI
ncbi:hypothetical protein OSB04_021851 [Centaurea solstitialis]|uniref:Phytocyanin domain-containing protein n=1 Tax=Centaurea solstitialis TaxID=347529 RepID=A0AA38TES6_9ASTR|nr:hypothetical protein OSB04_021851 [Centaurea solstitialis]